MYEIFTDRARKVLLLANAEAQRLNHEYIGTEHILLGLLREGTGKGVRVLEERGLSLSGIRNEVEALVNPGPDTITAVKLPLMPRARKVIEYALDEARGLCHNYVGTEHLLLALLKEGEGVASQVLRTHGLNLEDVREQVVTLVGHGRSEGRGSSAEREKGVSDESAVFFRDLLSVVECPKELVPALIMQLYEPHHYDRIQAIAKEALAEIKR